MKYKRKRHRKTYFKIQEINTVDFLTTFVSFECKIFYISIIMGKKGVTYIELVKINLDKARSDAKKIGSTFVPKESFSKAAAQWKKGERGQRLVVYTKVFFVQKKTYT